MIHRRLSGRRDQPEQVTAAKRKRKRPKQASVVSRSSRLPANRSKLVLSFDWRSWSVFCLFRGSSWCSSRSFVGCGGATARSTWSRTATATRSGAGWLTWRSTRWCTAARSWSAARVFFDFDWLAAFAAASFSRVGGQDHGHGKGDAQQCFHFQVSPNSMGRALGKVRSNNRSRSPFHSFPRGMFDLPRLSRSVQV